MRRSRIFYPRSRPQIVDQFLRFGLVGGIGFFIDWGTVESLRSTIGLIAATIAAYFVAATFNWILNRFWTFRTTSSDNQHLILQWARFLLANSCGFFLNRGAVFILYALLPITRNYPGIALAIGAACGMFANFSLSRKLVFRAKTPETPSDLLQMAVEFPASGLTSPNPEPHISTYPGTQKLASHNES
ncbi:GtrA family protein [Swingsia samuiensis]|uniref:GtrA family protein n=1 Tax=Swingsia samuiensis TaxID=1293412 RepID=A0A4Y6UL28_9PROT|nr:GtrA family protein [Swingsia samuiensis]QDH17500.1 GtrA family protein [Swingsia samuiensis]